MGMYLFPRAHLFLLVLVLPIALAVIWAARRADVRFPPTVGTSTRPSSSDVEQPAAQADLPCEEQLPAPLPKGVADGGRPANYLKLSDFTSVLVTDSHGHSEYPFHTSHEHPPGEPPTGQRVEKAVYDRGSPTTLLISTPAAEVFTFTFKTGDKRGFIDLTRGLNNVTPGAAMRYKDVALPQGTRLLLRVTPEGFEPLRADSDSDGTFETEVKPDVYVTGEAARDTNEPTFCVRESPRGAKTLVTVVAVDSSGVAGIFYSLDPPGAPATLQPYTGPIEVDAARTPFISLVADDKLANRSVLIYPLKGRE